MEIRTVCLTMMCIDISQGQTGWYSEVSISGVRVFCMTEDHWSEGIIQVLTDHW